jgi:hypothetical protein
MSRLPHEQTESPEELQYRIDAEKRLREVAEVVRAMLPEDRGFILISATLSEGDEPFSHTAYTSTIDRDDAERLLNELLDHWRHGEDRETEPTVKTATFLREQVKLLRQFGPHQLIAAMAEGVRDAADALARREAKECVVQVMTVAAGALAFYGSFNRMMRALGERELAAKKEGRTV